MITKFTLLATIYSSVLQNLTQYIHWQCALKY